MAVAAGHPCDIARSIVEVVFWLRSELAHPHELVLQREIRALATARHLAGDVLPAPVGEISMVSAGYQLGTVGKHDSVRRFHGPPVGQDNRLDVVAIGPTHLGSVYLVAHLDISERSMAAVGEQDRR